VQDGKPGTGQGAARLGRLLERLLLLGLLGQGEDEWQDGSGSAEEPWMAKGVVEAGEPGAGSPGLRLALSSQRARMRSLQGRQMEGEMARRAG